jgi:NAD(P)H-dependent FMN reductase
MAKAFILDSFPDGRETSTIGHVTVDAMRRLRDAHIEVIVGTDREGRFSEKAAAWIESRLAGRDDLRLEIVDLRDYPMPFYDQARPPAYGHREYAPDVARWAGKVDEADGYLVVTAEYNHGYPALLKNALDHAFPEFNRKPISFVGYGNVGGARAIEQLRLVSVELEMAPLRHAVHILPEVMRPVRMAGDDFDVEMFASLDQRLDTLADDLIWWAKALGRARAAA